MSDLNGYDPYIHGGTVSGMFVAICDIFTDFQPFPVSELRGFRRVYRAVRAFRMERFRAATVYRPDRFKQMVVATAEYVRQFAR